MRMMFCDLRLICSASMQTKLTCSRQSFWALLSHPSSWVHVSIWLQMSFYFSCIGPKQLMWRVKFLLKLMVRDHLFQHKPPLPSIADLVLCPSLATVSNVDYIGRTGLRLRVLYTDR
ncbi:hypothetical protein HanIR_Chr15g0773321 [Helianthus annuus]|nr:hypothetical protein HanIR_Chr15g0773321 [Helianthus annuus]